MMEKFAGYGFNKSHAAAYALVAYQTAYFKAHHPGRVHGGQPVARDGRHRQGARTVRDDASAQGLAMLPPDINASDYRFEPVDAKQHPLRPGRHQGHRRGGDRSDRRRARGGRAVQRSVRLLPARRQARRQPPRDRGADPRGAFDAIERAARGAARLGGRRARSGRARRKRSAAQVSLFGDEAAERRRRRCRRRATGPKPSGSRTRKSALGFYLSGHPFNGLRRGARAGWCARALADSSREQERVLIAGIVTAMRAQASRRGKMAFVTLDDGQRLDRDRRVYNETFDGGAHLLREDELVIAEVKVTQRMTDDGELQGLRVIAENVYDLADGAPAIRARACASRATATRPATGSRRSSRRSGQGDNADHHRLPEQRRRRRRRAARGVAREPRRRADRAPARVAAARERAGVVLTVRLR